MPADLKTSEEVANSNWFVKLKGNLFFIRKKNDCGDATRILKFNRQPTKPQGFNELPKDVLIKVFTHLSDDDLYKAGSVCCNWKNAAQHPVLIRRLEFRGTSTTPGEICRTLRFAKHLESAKFVRVPEIVTILRQLARCNKNIKELTVRHCVTPKNDWIPEATLRNVIASCKKIVALDLKGTQFISYRFFQNLRHLTHLRRLNVSSNRYFRVHDILTITINCNQLEEFRLSKLFLHNDQSSLTDQDVVLLLETLTSLKALALDVKGLSDRSYQAIWNCKTLQDVRLTNAHYLTNNLLQSLPNKLQELTKLKISNAYQISDTCFSNVFTDFRDILCNIVYLDLSGCWLLNNDSLIAIVNTCSSKLEHFSLQNCKSVSDEGIKYIITHCKKLIYLNVAFIKMSNDLLFLIPQQLIYLQKLITDDTPFMKSCLTKLAEMKQGLKIVNVMSEYNNIKRQYQ